MAWNFHSSANANAAPAIKKRARKAYTRDSHMGRKGKRSTCPHTGPSSSSAGLATTAQNTGLFNGCTFLSHSERSTR